MVEATEGVMEMLWLLVVVCVVLVIFVAARGL